MKGGGGGGGSNWCPCKKLPSRNLKVDEYPSEENIFVQTVLLMNTNEKYLKKIIIIYVVFPKVDP